MNNGNPDNFIEVTIWNDAAGTATYRHYTESRITYKSGAFNIDHSYMGNEIKNMITDLAHKMDPTAAVHVIEIDEIAKSFPQNRQHLAIMVRDRLISGYKYDDIAKKLGVGKPFISKVAKAYGLSRRKTK